MFALASEQLLFALIVVDDNANTHTRHWNIKEGKNIFFTAPTRSLFIPSRGCWSFRRWKNFFSLLFHGKFFAWNLNKFIVWAADSLSLTWISQPYDFKVSGAWDAWPARRNCSSLFLRTKYPFHPLSFSKPRAAYAFNALKKIYYRA